MLIVFKIIVLILIISSQQQILYAGEGESRKPDEGLAPSFDDSVGSTASLASTTGGARAATILFIKGHEFVQVKMQSIVCFVYFPFWDWGIMQTKMNHFSR